MKKTTKLLIFTLFLLFIFSSCVFANNGNIINPSIYLPNSQSTQNTTSSFNGSFTGNTITNSTHLNEASTVTNNVNPIANYTNTLSNNTVSNSFNTTTNTYSDNLYSTYNNNITSDSQHKTTTTSEHAQVSTSANSANSGLTTGDIISILLIVVGVVVILLGIAVLIRLNK